MIDRLSRLSLVLAITSVILGGCIPEESPIAPYDRGPVRETMFALGVDYGMQIYFDLESGAVVQANQSTAWDIGFRSDAGGYQVVLNGGALMAAADLGPVPFEEARSTTGAEWWHDRPGGSWDSTAVGTWWQPQGESVVSRGHVYLIDRGYRPDGRRRGYARLQMLDADGRTYHFRFADLDGSNDHTVTINRDTLRNITGFSFDNGGAPFESEPPKDRWDMLMTRYMHVFYTPDYTPYGVNGVLLNRSRTAAVLDTTHTFESITPGDVAGYSFTDHLDAVGYEWKWYDLNAGKYTVFPRFIYVVRRHDGLAVKLRFVDFYNDQGERGFPKMEWQKL